MALGVGLFVAVNRQFGLVTLYYNLLYDSRTIDMGMHIPDADMGMHIPDAVVGYTTKPNYVLKSEVAGQKIATLTDNVGAKITENQHNERRGSQTKKVPYWSLAALRYSGGAYSRKRPLPLPERDLFRHHRQKS
jgi:hypothetical protein